MIYKPHPYQSHSEDHIMAHDAAALFLEMGLGKTVITLSAVNRLLFEELAVSKVLVIAPLRTAQSTWTAERDQWDHLRHLRISKVLGTEMQRKHALKAKADIYVINRENVPWLVGYLGCAWPFGMVVIDELSSFKSPKSQRFKALRKVRPLIRRIVGLTGTPAPNSLVDLWSQVYLLDQGERLGTSVTAYRDTYFNPDKRNGAVIYNYKLKSNENEKLIYDKIGDICISMRAKDYLSLPARLDRTIRVDLGAALPRYIEFEKIQVMSMDTGVDITAFNAAALSNKLVQFANGAVYDADGGTHYMHDAKLDALDEIIEGATGNPVLVFYWFKSDLARLKQRYKDHDWGELKGEKDIQAWNDGKIPLLFVHPASAGHGLNLQAGGNIIVWFGLTWSLELYQQANARLHRQGQQKAVIVHHLIATGTIDEDIMRALQRKEEGQDALMEAVKVRRLKYGLVA